jgi:hypothetical protein
MDKRAARRMGAKRHVNLIARPLRYVFKVGYCIHTISVIRWKFTFFALRIEYT